MPRGTNKKESVIGDEAWPFAVPLVKTVNGWGIRHRGGQSRGFGWSALAAQQKLAVVNPRRAYVSCAAEIRKSTT